MNRETYQVVEAYMHTCMEDSAHDREHVYRVLHTALLIAREEENVDYDVLICACLLHDIGRKEQFADPKVCHAMAGGEKAFDFLTQNGFENTFAQRVRHCIEAHRFRTGNQPQSLEAKIVFDADKLDACGAMGVARTLMYAGQVSAPLYMLTPEGKVSDGNGENSPSFFREYTFKLEKLYDRFYTKRGRELAMARKEAAAAFYHALLREARESHDASQRFLEMLLQA